MLDSFRDDVFVYS